MLPDAIPPAKWTCQNCGQVSFVYGVDASNTIGFSASHEVGLKSSDHIDGVPVREIHETTTPRGDAFTQKVQRTPEECVVERELKLIDPYRRRKGDKRQEECDAASRMLQQYNESHGTDYDSVRPDEADKDTDVIAMSSSRNHPDLPIQVVTEGSQLWQNLAQSKTHFESVSEQEFLTQLKESLLHKQTRAGPKIVLVYDGPGVITPSTLELFTKQHAEAIQQINFKEIWYCSRSNSSCVKRLK